MSMVSSENYSDRRSSKKIEFAEEEGARRLQASDVAAVLASFASREAATVEEVVALATQLSAVLDTKFEQAQIAAAMPDSKAEVFHKPAIDPAKSVHPDYVTCLCCGKEFTMLKRHLKAEHGLTEAEYRARFGLDPEHPLVAPNYSNRKAEYAKRIGLGKHSREMEAPKEAYRNQ